MAFRHFLVGIMGGVVGGIYIAQNYEWLGRKGKGSGKTTQAWRRLSVDIGKLFEGLSMSVIYPRPGNKATVYVGGFDETLDESKLHAAFIPFGELKEVFIPRDRTSDGGPRGFGFVEFKHAEDAKSAIDNMHMSQIWGQTIRCNLARPTRITTAGIHTAPVWELEAAAGSTEAMSIEETENSNEDMGAKSLIE